MNWGKIRITGGFALLWAVLLWFDTGTLVWVWAAVLTHELGHWTALRLFGGKAARWDLSIIGLSLEFDSRSLPYRAEILVTMAGPAASLLAAFVCSQSAVSFGWQNGYVLAGANLLLGLFNLLPAKALDGGRILWHLLCWRFGPEPADRAGDIATVLTGTGIALMGLYIFIQSRYNISLLAIGLYLLFTTLGGTHVRKIGSPAAASAKTRALFGR